MIRATVRGSGVTAERVAAYLPSNYSVTDSWVAVEPNRGPVMVVVIEGTDSMGWTFDDYVAPRLASGLMFATRIS